MGNEKAPQVTIEMEAGGKMIIELYPDKAPNTVLNFLSLVQSGFYDGVIFHRVIPGFMIQGGDPRGTGMGGPGYCIKGEFASNRFRVNDIVHARGVISMARAMQKDSGGSQFFICVEDAPHLDGEYAAFGKVIEGMDTADAIAAAGRDRNDKPHEKQCIRKATADTFGVSYEQPKKIG